MADEKTKPAQPAPQPAKPEQTPEQLLLEKALSMSEDQVLPWEETTLPSQGAYYDGAVPGGRIQVRPMGLFADKILATQRLAQSGKSLDWLFRKCVKFPDGKFDPLSLLAGDRVFLLYYLRGITHGNNYEYIVQCTNEDCGQSIPSDYDFNKLYRTVKGPNTALGPEPFKVLLPHMSKVMGADFWVKVRLLRGYDMQSMLTQKRVIKKVSNVGRTPGDKTSLANEQIDDTLEDNLNMLIIEAMGSTDKAQIRKLIGRLHATDTATIREFLKDNSPGIDTSIIVNCPACSQEMRMELPITESFFRPTTTRNS